MLFFLLAACAAPTDRFSETADACRVQLTPVCRGRLSADFGLDGDAPGWWWDGALELLDVADTLDTLPLRDAYIRRPMLHWLHGVPGQTPGAQLYNRVAFEISATSFEASGVVAENLDGEVVWGAEQVSPHSTASTLIHEAAHGRLLAAHVACPDGHPLGGDCDQGWGDPYGVEVGVAHWIGLSATDDDQQEDYWGIRDRLRPLILAD